MTADQLIAEGRKLQRPCSFLRPEPAGEVAAIWHSRDEDEIADTGLHCWITVDARFIPGLPDSVKGFISVFSNEEDCEGGKIEVSTNKPNQEGTKLYAHSAAVIPPLDLVMLKGSDAVGEWLQANKWQRDWGYNGNLKDVAAKAYQEIWFKEYPIYFNSDIYAVLGGWHFAWPDGDWLDLMDDQLMIQTFRDSEPWIEAWRLKSGDFKVLQRIT